MRIGIGYDVHKLEKGRKLVLGGVEIDHTLGLVGHSDADVLLHAIMDAMFGAAAMGDIGRHFPDTDERYRGVSSLRLLKRASVLLEGKGYKIGNVDAVIVAQEPKLAPFIEQMRTNIADTLGVDVDRISVKATTEEGLGFTGNKSGISCQAVCLLE